MPKKTLAVENISAIERKIGALAATARAGAHLASLCRGAIRGCDARNDPDGKVAAMLTNFLKIAGFELPELE